MAGKRTIIDWFKEADQGGYAVPAFNYSDIWDMLAIVDAAVEMRSPVMLACNPLVAKAIGVEVCGGLGKTVMEQYDHPIYHHLDHSPTPELCYGAIRHGYPSVMIDASKYELSENIRITGEVVQVAHAMGVAVEAEIGRIQGKGIEGDFEGGDFLVQVDEAVKLVEQTKVDSLAVGIGTAHGFYKGKPEINFERLSEVNEAVDIPLVLHGGTGIPKEDIQKAISRGINKVNVGTIVHVTYMQNLRKSLDGAGEAPYTLDVVKPVREQIKQVVKGWIEVCMSAGKA
ncbi:class II fructose-bisphosphate aldolase [Ruminococcaceae bacterium OttesenSCG-928-I18]|nr:class II fructose-bisphosphate aldolase [Ruminococcaceae bacterium OttesenSCG-928-I18]